MKKVIITLGMAVCIAINLNTEAKAQCYFESISVSDWIEHPCYATQKSYADSVNALTPGKICVARIGMVDYMIFLDQLGNRHQIHVGSIYDGINFAMFRQTSPDPIVIGKFDFGSQRLLRGTLDINDAGYFIDEFETWGKYMSIFFVPKNSGLKID